MTSRLIAFGCSFTYQNYPTWADILGLSYDSYENLGRGGAGHRYILTALQHRLLQGDISADDTVVVQWSSSHRFDTYMDGRWLCRGGVVHDREMLDFSVRRWDEDSAMLETLSHIVSAIHILEGMRVRWYMCQLDGLDRDERFAGISRGSGMLARLRSHIDAFSDRWARAPISNHCASSGLPHKEWLENGGVRFFDAHPTPMMSYLWLRDCLAPIMGPMPIPDHAVATSLQARHDACVSSADIARVWHGDDWHNQNYVRDERYLDWRWTA